MNGTMMGMIDVEGISFIHERNPGEPG